MLSYIRLICYLMILVTSAAHASSEKGLIRVALDDLPGVDMLPTLIAIERSKERGVSIDVSYMLSEGMAMRTIVNEQADVAMGAPYKRIQETKAPIRMFYQLYKLRFHPVVNTKHFKDWSELDGVVMYSHGAGSGTEALVNMMAKKNGIKYSKMVYLPGSGVRANAMINGRINATVVDTERKNQLLSLQNSPFLVLPMPEIDASDETLYAHESFIKSHAQELSVLVEELLFVWREMNVDPGFVLKERDKYQLLPKLQSDKITQFFVEMVGEGAFPSDAGRENAFIADMDFYGFAGTVKDPASQQEKDYWDFSILDKILKH